MSLEFRISSDGSHTLYNSELGETYHSNHGAIQEAYHVFIKAGLEQFSRKSLKIFEMGFGTGLNALISALEAKKRKVDIHYTSIESRILGEEVWTKLNYCDELDLNKSENKTFTDLHLAKWGDWSAISDKFWLRKLEIELADLQLEESFDLIYYDAFGPRVQPHLWTEEVFEKMYDLLSEQGKLLTYCAKGSVKRALRSAGFEVESLPGPPGKREMTRANK